MSPSFPATSLAGIRFNGEQRQLAQAYLAVCADLFENGHSTTAWHLAAEALRLQPSLVTEVGLKSPEHREQSFRVDDVALPVAPQYVRASALLARANHFVFGQGTDNRLADIDSALTLVPDCESALLERADLLHASASLDERAGELLRLAIDDYSRILRARPNELKALRQRARAHVHGARRDYANALADYDRIMALAPPTADDYSDRAWALQNLGRFEEAVAEYTRAIEGRGCSTGWNLGLRLDFRNRGKCNFRIGRYQEALQDFVTAQEILPRTGDELLLFQSQTLSKLGRMEEAQAVLRQARKRNSDVEQHYANWLIED